MDKTNIVQFNPFGNENNYLKLVDSMISNLNIENATFTSCLFDVGVWKKLNFINCHFNSCVFSNLDLSNCIFNNCTFAYCKVEACKWIGGSLVTIIWKKCQLKYNQWIMCLLDDSTTDYVDEFSEQSSLSENTATWTLSHKIMRA